MKLRTALMLVLIAVLALPLAPSAAQEPVELRITWYDDGNEGAVLRDLLDRFEADNSDITVVVDTVPYSAILENLPLQLEAGEGPDIARVTDLGGLSQYYLDLRPYLSDAAYWEDNFGPYLTWLRQPGDEEGIFGFQTQLTVTGMYINRTLFEQAGVEVPSDTSEQVSWEEWGQTCKTVAEAIGPDVFGFAMDRSGHRFAGPAISMGAQYFDENGHPIVTDAGYRAMAELFVQWHQDGTALVDVWAATPGYVGANEDYANGRLACYMSGSWQVQQFSQTIGDAFDWEVVPFPCGPAGCTGVPGGAAVVAIKDTEHPEEVARVMEYLVQEDVLREFHARTLFIPAHAGVAAGGVPFETDLDLARAALEQWSAMVPDIMPLAVRIQGYPYNRIVFDASRDRLAQAIVGELTLDEAIQRTQEDIDSKLAELEG